MKILGYIMSACLLWSIFGLWVVWFSNAEDKVKCAWGIWECYGSDAKPMNILDDLIENDDSEIIETRLDLVDRDEWQFATPELKLSDTLDSVRQNISIYLQWMVFIWLVFAVILIIYNWLMLMLSPLSPDQAWKVKTRLTSLVIWVVLVTWFFFILKILISVYVDVFVD